MQKSAKPIRFRRTESVRQKFLSKVKKTGKCWKWLGELNGRDGNKRGRLWVENNIYLPHRLSYYLFKGQPGYAQVLHTCDNPACVNPKHLYLGSNTDNQGDAARKNRHNPFGVKRLTPEIIKEIRRVYRKGMGTIVGRRFGIGRNHVNRIIKREAWSHVK